MSETERTDLLDPERELTATDIRELTAAVTPHFALQVRNRVRRLIAPLAADDPARIEGERQIAKLEAIADRSGDSRRFIS